MRICSKEIEICTYLYIYIIIYTLKLQLFFSSVHSFKQHEAAGLNLEKFDQVWRSKTITKGWWGWMWKGVEGAIWICVAFQPSETTCQNRKRSCTEYRRNPWVLNAAKMRTLWRVLKRAVTREDMWQWPSTFCWSIPWFWRKWRSDSSTSGPKTHWLLLQQLSPAVANLCSLVASPDLYRVSHVGAVSKYGWFPMVSGLCALSLSFLRNSS